MTRMLPDRSPARLPNEPTKTPNEVDPRMPQPDTAVPATAPEPASFDALAWARDEVAAIAARLDPYPTLGDLRVTCGHRWSESDAGIELTFFCVRAPEHPGDCDHGVRDLAHGQLDGAP